MSTFQNPGLNALVASLQKVSEPFKATNGMTVTALCPAHDDRNPSLFITEKANGKPLIICRGCGAKGVEVADAVGMRWTEITGYGCGKPYGKSHKTGHSHAALVARASTLIHESFLIMTGPDATSSESRLALARAAGTLNGISEEMRRSDK